MNKAFIPGYISTFSLQKDLKRICQKNCSLAIAKTLAIMEGESNGKLWLRMSKGLYSVVGNLG